MLPNHEKKIGGQGWGEICGSKSKNFALPLFKAPLRTNARTKSNSVFFNECSCEAVHILMDEKIWSIHSRFSNAMQMSVKHGCTKWALAPRGCIGETSSMSHSIQDKISSRIGYAWAESKFWKIFVTWNPNGTALVG